MGLLDQVLAPAVALQKSSRQEYSTLISMDIERISPNRV
jgi:hypothetical protein